VESPIPKAQVIILWPTTDCRRDVAAARQCSVLADILCERVREKVREELGKTYTPTASADMSDTFTNDGMLLCSLSCEVAEARKVGQIVAQLAATLAAEGATADELQRAKKPILSGVEKESRDNGWWMSQLVATAQSQPQRLGWFRSRKADYEAVDLETVNRLAKTYLSRDRAIIVLAGPGDAGKQTAAR
jgi:zinc protease